MNARWWNVKPSRNILSWAGIISKNENLDGEAILEKYKHKSEYECEMMKREA
jgi:hypothetical protein